MFSRRPALFLVFALLSAGCSSSSSAGDGASETPGDDNDSGMGTPSDGGPTSGDDATVSKDSGAHKPAEGGPGGDASSPNDAGTAANVDASTSGDAGIAAVCAGLCGSLQQCALTLDAGPAQPCHCDVSGTQLLRADYVQALTGCVSTTIASSCASVAQDGGTDAVVQNCEATVASSIEPTPTAAMFCKNLGLSFCANAIPNCITQVFTYSDPTLVVASNCLPKVPNSDIDGGCNDYAACLNAAFTP
jgi:hypothetical protein